MAKKTLPSVPSQAAPHPKLMALVDQFLQHNGFHAAHQTYATERTKITAKKHRKDAVSDISIANLPPLETIFQTWLHEHSREASSASSSDDDSSNSPSDDDTDSEDIAVSNHSAEEDSSSNSESSSESSSDSDSAEEADEVENITTTVIPGQKSVKSMKRKLSYSSSETSDTSDEEDTSVRSPIASRPSKKARIGSTSSSSSSGEESDSVPESATDSDSDSDSNSSSISTTQKMALNTKLPSSSESSLSESSDDDTSESESSSNEEADTDVMTTIVPLVDQALSDSSGTIMGDVGIVQTASDSSIEGEAVETTQVVATKRRHIGAHPTRLAQISATADLNDYVSNTYVSYDYADKAYKDLSVTRGKGFTKEKNKKKRGSYRGGAIDISGGKAFKFDD